jgi:endoglucanase
MEQKQPYFDHDIRNICHTRVFLTESPAREEQIEIKPGDSVIQVYGGYHDAGDADRRDHHMVAPIVLLSYYDMFPQYFRDLQYNIPDKFDAEHSPAGQGNGIPDVIDEVEWGTKIFEFLQDKSGGVRSGTERNGYPNDGVCLDVDTVPYAAFKISKNSTTLAAGLFAHLARAIKPFNPARAAELQKRAETAWAYAGETAKLAHKFYFYTQYYLLTGDRETHDSLIKIAPAIKAYETQHDGNPRETADKEVLLGAYFFSYLAQTDRPKDPDVVKMFESTLKVVAEKRMAELDATPYPNGTLQPNRWWGSQTAQGQYADPLIMLWRLTKEQKYIDAACKLMDYNLGVNPLGKSYMTGIGFDRTNDPLHHDSYPMKDKGWGPAPGLLVFGPGNLKQLKEQCPEMIPDIRTLPPQRQYLDNRKHVSANEFTVPESLAYPSVIYTILAQGGIWDKKTILKQ